MATEPTDAELDRLAAMLGFKDAAAVLELAADQVARVARGGHRIGEGHRPFPPECGRLEAI